MCYRRGDRAGGSSSELWATLQRAGLGGSPAGRSPPLGPLTTMHRCVPGGRQVRTSLVMKCAAEGLLCRLTREGSAATVAQFR